MALFQRIVIDADHCRAGAFNRTPLFAAQNRKVHVGLLNYVKEGKVMCILRSAILTIVGMIALFAAGMLASPSRAEIDPATIVGLWLFDDVAGDTVRDLSGNGHDGTLNGGPVVVAGKFGQALKFDGTDDVVNCGNAGSLNPGVFTVTFWANVPATQGWNHMISKGDHVASGTPGSVNWGVMMRSGEARFLFEIFEDTEWTGISAPEVPLNEWQHIAATYDGDKMEFFLNGVSLGSSAEVKMKLDASRSFLIGARSAAAAPASYFNGSIDEVGFFSAVLSLEDIQSLINDGIGIAAVSPAGKSAVTWAGIKDQY